MVSLTLFADFLHLVQSRNFSASARGLGISQSSLSRRMAQLEAYVGSPLFDRSLQPVALTDAGEKLVPLAEDLLERAQDIKAIGHACAPHGDAPVRLIALSSLAMHFYPQFLAQDGGAGRPWQITLRNTEPTLAGNIAHFLHGRADFLLTFSHERVPDLLALRNHRYVVLGEERAVPVSVPAKGGGAAWSLESGSAVNYCGYARGSFHHQVLAGMIERHKLDLAPVHENAMAAVIHSMIRQGGGMGWLPMMVAGEDLARGDLVRAGPPSMDVSSQIRLYRAHILGRTAKEFWAFVSQHRPVLRTVLNAA